jgi:putative FmdB family regulatory protein
MPIYEYRCEKGHDFEVLQKMGDDAVTVCDVCEAPVRKVFRPVAVHFKGSGFYNTDYGTRNRSREKEAAEGGKSEGSKDSKDSSSKDSSSKDSKSDSSSSKSESSKSDSGTSTSKPKAAAGD